MAPACRTVPTGPPIGNLHTFPSHNGSTQPMPRTLRALKPLHQPLHPRAGCSPTPFRCRARP
eukprot:362670-Chlamydomonas_euryale.AAC.5